MKSSSASLHQKHPLTDMLRLLLLVTIGTIISKSKTTGIQRSRRDSGDDEWSEWNKVLDEFNKEYADAYNKIRLAEWNYESNVTAENLRLEEEIVHENLKRVGRVAQLANRYHWEDLSNETIKRQFSKLCEISDTAFDGYWSREHNKFVNEMKIILREAKICDYNDKSKCNLSEREIVEVVMKSRDPQELKYIWTEWRKVSGEQVRSLYPRFVEASNSKVASTGFPYTSAYWLDKYETDEFPDRIEALWQEIKPFYSQLHAYVRRELRKKYGEDVVSKDGPIPAHLLGNIWAQSWENIVDFTKPFPMKKSIDVSSIMVEKGYNATQFFRLAEDFFVSMNLTAMPELFWKNSILGKLNDGGIKCTAGSAWDFYDGQDFRLNQCAQVNMDDFEMAHCSMSYVEYFMQYKDQPAILRAQAGPGFFDAICSLVKLSVSTTNHLTTIGLLNDDPEDKEMTINNLYLQSLRIIASLPSMYMMDRWRWDVFQEEVTPNNYNRRWWMLAEEIQGIEPPVDRSEEDFDPGADHDVVENVERMPKFVSRILQYQFYKTLCTAAKQYDPQNVEAKVLSECDIYNSKDAGNMLKSMMQLGSSKPWQDAVKQLTGERRLSAKGLLEYYKPLIDWLKEENQKTNEYIGWKPSVRRCVKTRSELPANAPVKSNIYE